MSDALLLELLAQLHNPWHARMTFTAAQNMANATWGIMPYDTIDYDPSSMITTGTSAHFTALVSGIYLVQAAVGIGTSSSTGLFLVDAVKNILSGYSATGGTRLFGNSASGGGINYADNGSAVMSLAANDTISIWSYQATGGVVAVSVGNAPYQTYASMTFLAPT